MAKNTISRRKISLCFFLVGWVFFGFLDPITFAAGEAGNEVAKIGMRIITSQDLQGMIEDLERIGFKTKKSKIDLLKELVRIEVFSREARAVGLDQDQELKRKITRAINFFLAKEFVKRNVLNSISISEEEIKTYYQTHPEQFQEPKKMKVRQIFLHVDPGATPQEIQMKKELAEDLLHRIKAGEDFSELSSDFSTDPMLRERGGDLGYIARGALSPAYDEAVFALKVGGVSRVLQGEFGFSIFKKEGLRSARIRPFEKVRWAIKQKLQQLKEDRKFLELEKRLFSKYHVKIWEEKLKEDSPSEKQPSSDESFVHTDEDRILTSPEAPYLETGQPATPGLPGYPKDPAGEIKSGKPGSTPSKQ